VNRNPKDTHNHPNGVWSLLPDLEVKAEDKERYRAIGESDRMTLKFRKPAK
jgi:predicted methyltransferase